MSEFPLTNSQTYFPFQKRTDKEKTEKFIDTWILYVMVGLSLIVMFSLFLMFIYISRNTKNITGIVNKLNN